MSDEQPTKSPGYSKRPLWQWILIYAIVGLVAYALLYYFIFAKKSVGY